MEQSPGIRSSLPGFGVPVFRGGFFAVGKLNFCLLQLRWRPGESKNFVGILSRINAHIAKLGMQHMGHK